MKVLQVCIRYLYLRQLYFGTQHYNISTGTTLLWWRLGKIWTSSKTLVSKKTPIWRLKKSQSNDKPNVK